MPAKDSTKSKSSTSSDDDHPLLIAEGNKVTSTTIASPSRSSKATDAAGSGRMMSYASWDEGESNDYSDGGGDGSLGKSQRYKGGQMYSRVDSQDDDEQDDLEEGGLSRLQDDEDEDEDIQDDSLLNAHSDSLDDVERQRQQRSTRRRVYGGGMGQDQGDRGVLSTAFNLLSHSIAPGIPLLIPYAFSLTGLSFGVPLLIILTALGSSFSHVILTVEARYVGAKGYPSLASATFPQIYGINWLGEMLINLFSAFVSGARALVALYISTDLFIDLFLHLLPNAALLHSKIFVSTVIVVAFLLPSLLLPRHHRSFLPSSSLFLSELPVLSVLLYPVILLIVGVSLKNLSDYPSLLKPNPHLGKPHWSREPLHTPTLWSGVSVLFFACASNQQYTFTNYRHLRRSASSASAGKSTDNLQDPTSGNVLERLLKRHRWESSTILAALMVGLVLAGFGVVGYVSLLTVTPNMFSVLPKDHAWFNFARVLSLLTVLSLMSTSMEPCKVAFSSLLAVPRRCWIARSPYPSQSRGHRGANGNGNAHMHKRRRRTSSAVAPDFDDDFDSEEDTGPSGSYHVSQARNWENRLANLLAWAIVLLLACLIRDLGGIAEVVGGVGSTWFGYILPAIFFIALFHVRSPRTIFMTSSSSAQIQTDQLLLQKERQLQKRLMGRRLWMDLSTFGLLLPVGIVGFIRGVWALAAS